MDSANNSSSLQSSSGGDEEFNSHNFFATTNPNPNHHNIGISIDNSINNIISSSINSGMIRNVSVDNLPLPDSAFSFFGQASSASSSSPLLPNPNPNPNPINPPTKTTPAPAPRTNPRKRSRASRRAPTTVMTTDTSNFRAMVQEFTGIPSPPFSSSSYPSRPRLGFSAPPSFLLKPYPQKQIQMPPAVLLQASRSAANGGLINDYRMHPSTSNFQLPLLQSQHLDDDSAVAGLGQPTIPIGSGWRPDPTQHGTVGSSKVKYNNADISKGGDPARGDGMVESWICSSD